MLPKKHFKKAVPVFLLSLLFFAPASQALAARASHDGRDGRWHNRDRYVYRHDHRGQHTHRHHAHCGHSFRHHNWPVVIWPKKSIKIILGGQDHDHHYRSHHQNYIYRETAQNHLVVPPLSGTIVASLPEGAQSVAIEGGTYWMKDGVYYRDTNQGYEVIPAPSFNESGYRVLSTASRNTPGAVTVNVPDSDGGYSAVLLKKSGNGYLGPQGEYYPAFPKVEQLQAMYSK